MSDNSANKRIARNSIFLTIRMVFVLGITLYATKAVLDLLGVEDYGVYNVVCGFVSMFAFLNTSMSNGIQRFFNFELGKNGTEGANKVFCTAMLIQVILAFIIIALCESFGMWYLHNKMVIPEGRMAAAYWIFHFSMLNFLIVILQAPYTAAVMAHEKMDFYAIVNVLDAFLKLGIIFLIPYLVGDYLILYGFLMVLIALLSFVLYFIYCRRSFAEIRLNGVFHKDTFKSMLSFSGWNLFGSFSNMMRDQGINLILNLFFGPIVNAARGVAMQINSGVNSFVSNILTPVRPQVIQSYAKGEFERAMRLTYSISKFGVSFLFMMSLPVCLEINYILRLWLGSNIPDHTNEFVIIILLTSAVLVLMGALATMVHASGVMRNYQVIGSIVKFLSVPISYIMLKSGSEPEWALIMVLIFDIVGFIVGLIIIKGIMPFSIWDYSKNVVFPLIPITTISILSVYPFTLLINEGFLRLVLVTIVSSIVIIISLYFIGLNKSEKELINPMLKKVISKFYRNVK